MGGWLSSEPGEELEIVNKKGFASIDNGFLYRIVEDFNGKLKSRTKIRWSAAKRWSVGDEFYLECHGERFYIYVKEKSDDIIFAEEIEVF